MYIAGRSASNGADAVEKVKALYPRSDGDIEFIYLDLSDLTTLKPAADLFLSKERRLDGLIHNAGVMGAPTSWRTVQVIENIQRIRVLETCTNEADMNI